MIAWPSHRPLPFCAVGLVLVVVAACGGDGSTNPSDVAEITLDADQVVLDATGQLRQLDATARDDQGNTVNVAIDWATGDPEVVIVEGDGLLVAQGPGTTQVTASVGEVSASATVGVNSTARLEVFDGNGQTELIEALTGLPDFAEVLGQVAGRPAAMITFLDGMWIRRPDPRAIIGFANT